MNTRWQYVVVYFYTVGVLFTGIFVQRSFVDVAQIGVLAIGAVIAGLWLVYFRFGIESRLEKLADPEADDDEENPTPVPTIDEDSRL